MHYQKLYAHAFKILHSCEILFCFLEIFSSKQVPPVLGLRRILHHDQLHRDHHDCDILQHVSNPVIFPNYYLGFGQIETSNHTIRFIKYAKAEERGIEGETRNLKYKPPRSVATFSLTIFGSTLPSGSVTLSYSNQGLFEFLTDFMQIVLFKFYLPHLATDATDTQTRILT